MQEGFRCLEGLGDPRLGSPPREVSRLEVVPVNRLISHFPETARIVAMVAAKATVMPELRNEREAGGPADQRPRSALTIFGSSSLHVDSRMEPPAHPETEAQVCLLSEDCFGRSHPGASSKVMRLGNRHRHNKDRALQCARGMPCIARDEVPNLSPWRHSGCQGSTGAGPRSITRPAPGGTPDKDSIHIRGLIQTVEVLGHERVIYLRAEDRMIEPGSGEIHPSTDLVAARLPEGPTPQPGEHLTLTVKPHRFHSFDRQGNRIDRGH